MKRGLSLYAFGLLPAALLLAAGCSRPRNDAQLASDVQRQIYSDPSIHTRKLSIQSHDGIVTLNGSVTNDPERFTAAADAANVEGVKTVVNDVQVVPEAHAKAQQPSPSAPGVPAAIATNAPAAQAEAQQRSTLTSPSPAKQPRRHKSKARVHTTEAKAKNSSAQSTAANTTQGSGLPYSVSAPPSSPVGASESSVHSIVPPSTPQLPSQASAASSPPVKPAATPQPAPVAVPVPPLAPQKPVTIPSGTTVSVRLLDRIDTAASHPGESFRATLNAPLVDESGVTVVPKGCEVTGKIVNVRSAGHFGGSSELALELTQITLSGRQYSLQTDQYTRQGKSRGKSTAEKVGGGAALGAILGGIFGGAKGAAIGATVGAGAGTGVQAMSRGQQIVLRPETALNFQLASALSIAPTTQSPQGARSDQRAGNTPANNSAAEDGPPVLKRRR